MTYDRDLLIKELVRDEGERLQAYKDSLGLWTIGVGHLIGEDPGRPGSPRMWLLTTAESRALLALDIEEAETRLSKIFPQWRVDLDPVRQRALLNMTFNLGLKLLQFQKFRALMDLKSYKKAAAEMLDSKWATQVGDRAKRLSEMIEKGA